MYLMKRQYEDKAYWRKENAIHNWFVQNVQEGVDDCHYYEVSISKLQELVNLVDTVLADNSKAEELLPTTQGFFFGKYDYDEDYFQGLRDTKEQLEKIIKEDEDGEYVYHSSW